MEQQTQAYKIFTKIGLNNWHYIDRKVLSLNREHQLFHRTFRQRQVYGHRRHADRPVRQYRWPGLL